MTPVINPCPFCGGKARLWFRECDFAGKTHSGDKKSKYIFQVMCNKCHSRGRPIKSDYLINANPWNSLWGGRNYGYTEIVRKETEKYRVWAEKAIDAWNILKAVKLEDNHEKA